MGKVPLPYVTKVLNYVLLYIASSTLEGRASLWPTLPSVHEEPQGQALRVATLGELNHWHRYINGTSPYFCFETCCWRYEATIWPYRGLQPGKVTKEDLISPINNRFLADVVYGTRLRRPEGYELRTYREEYRDCLQLHTIIWVDTPDLPNFFAYEFGSIRSPFVLATGDSDDTAPKPYLQYFAQDKIVHWLAMNCDMPGETTPKLSCLPLGVSQWWYKDQVNDENRFLVAMERALAAGVGLQQGVLPSPHHPKQKLLLVAFNIASNARIRGDVWRYACEGPLREVSTCVSGATLEETYRLSAEHAFVMAPEGNGMDTYRAWETLYLGSYPVVFTNSLKSQYRGLPVLELSSLSEMTLQLLEETYAVFRSRTWNYERLYLGHYHERLGHHRPGHVKEYKIGYYSRTQR